MESGLLPTPTISLKVFVVYGLVVAEHLPTIAQLLHWSCCAIGPKATRVVEVSIDVFAVNHQVRPGPRGKTDVPPRVPIHTPFDEGGAVSTVVVDRVKVVVDSEGAFKLDAVGLWNFEGAGGLADSAGAKSGVAASVLVLTLEPARVHRGLIATLRCVGVLLPAAFWFLFQVVLGKALLCQELCAGLTKTGFTFPSKVTRPG
mmetsp:Transcript_93510/g.204779  ORF Transcript_93510/g.204779 Transcript_93510/m.204779 type:complete len:202 (+) Transcript_93510:3619-4224(+)